MMLEQMLAQWRRLVASIEALNHLHQAICMVSYQCIVISIKMASKVVHPCCFAWFSGGTEQVVAQWRCLEASGVAQDMLHRAMHSVLHRCTAMASEIASGGGTSVIHR